MYAYETMMSTACEFSCKAGNELPTKWSVLIDQNTHKSTNHTNSESKS